MSRYFPGERHIVEYAFVSGKRNNGRDSHKGHRERLRRRFSKNGFSGFNDYEVVELLLTLVHVQRDTKEIGKDLIRTFGSVRGILDATPRELRQIPGIGPASAVMIKVMRALAEYYLEERALGIHAPLTDSRAVADYLRLAMGNLDREQFRVVYMDAQNRPITNEALFEGTLTSSVVYPREVFKRAFDHGAASIILAHNHPSGCVDPSAEDRRITSDLVLAADYMDMHVLDHIVVGADEHFSFADHGLMEEYRRKAMDFRDSRRSA